jgi:signal transduction histidine kinase
MDFGFTTFFNTLKTPAIVYSLKNNKLHLIELNNKSKDLLDISSGDELTANPNSKFSPNSELTRLINLLKINTLKLSEQLVKANELSTESELNFSEKFKGDYYNFIISKLEDDKNVDKCLFLLEINKIFKSNIAQTSHELKRPIQNIKSLTETLLMGAYKDTQLAEKFLNSINSETDRLSSMVNDILRLSYYSYLDKFTELSKHKLKPLIDKQLEHFKLATNKKGIQIKNELIDSIEFKLEPESMSFLLANLLDNAIKYNQDGGSITLKYTKNTFIIEDTGIGIAQEKISKIFEPFYRAENSRKYSGSGLGLSIVKTIIDLHDWDISYLSEPGKGTKVSIKVS